MSWPAPGVYPNIPPADYFGLKEINGVLVRSNSMLHQFDKDPALFKAGHEMAATDLMRKGSIFDCLITQPHRFNEEYVISEYDDFRSNAAKEWRDNQTKTICKASELHDAKIAVAMVHQDPRWKEITKGNCQFQVGMRSDINGHPWKTLIDILPDEDGPFGDHIIDLKRCSTTESIEDVLRTCRKFLYNHQLGLYRGVARLNGLKRSKAALFIVPSSGPITPCVLELGEQMLSNGANAIMRINQRLIECEQTGIWPGRFDGIKKIEQADESWQWTEVLPELQEA